MRIAALVKQVPAIAEMALGSDGRLIRTGTELEMSAYCRRAVSKAVELASQRSNCSVTVFTLGPPSAEEVLREAVAWGLDRNVEIDGLLIHRSCVRRIRHAGNRSGRRSGTQTRWPFRHGAVRQELR